MKPCNGWTDQKIGGNTVRVRRESVSTLAASLRDHKNWLAQCSHTFKSSIKEGRERDWDLGKGWDGVWQDMETGDTKRAQKIADLAGRIAAKIQGKVAGDITKWRWSMEGKRFNPGRFLAGDPNCMGRRRKARSKYGKVIRVGVSICLPWWVKAKSIEKHGAVSLAICMALEKRGFDMGLYAIAKNGNNKGKRVSTLAVEAKAPSAYTNPAKIAACLGSPGFFRRICFAAWEQDEPSWPDYYGWGYGKANQKVDQSDAQHFGLDVVIPGMREWGNKIWERSEEEIVEWFLSTGWDEIRERMGIK